MTETNLSLPQLLIYASVTASNIFGKCSPAHIMIWCIVLEAARGQIRYSFRPVVFFLNAPNILLFLVHALKVSR